jgi:type II secretion system protein G
LIPPLEQGGFEQPTETFHSGAFLMSRKAFTLIELLIVVAIIAILAAIAVPNFLEAQTRSKISRAKADMRSLATALEAYCVDQNGYPIPSSRGMDLVRDAPELTTPVSYITSIPHDTFGYADHWGSDTASAGQPFAPQRDTGYKYCSFKKSKSTLFPAWADLVAMPDSVEKKGYILYSYGPDKAQSQLEWWAAGLYVTSGGIQGVYDPTNGTVSNGDIGRVGGAADKDAAAILSR